MLYKVYDFRFMMSGEDAMENFLIENMMEAVEKATGRTVTRIKRVEPVKINKPLVGGFWKPKNGNREKHTQTDDRSHKFVAEYVAGYMSKNDSMEVDLKKIGIEKHEALEKRMTCK